MVYPKLISNNPQLRVFVPFIEFLLKTPLQYVFKYLKLDYKLLSVRFDYADDRLRDVILSEHKNGKAIRPKEIYFLCCKGWRKKIIFSFLGEHKYPPYVWKVAEGARGEQRLNNECYLIRKLSLLDPHISEAVPQVIHEGFANNEFAVLESVKEGDLLIKSLFAHRNSLRKIDDILSLIRDWLILLHKKSCETDRGRNHLSLRNIALNSLRLYRETIFLDEEELQYVCNLLDKEICATRGLHFPFVIQHGDFQPENILYNKTNKEIAVFDWEYALEKGLPLIDLLNFLLISLSFALRDKLIDTKHPLHFIQPFTSLKYNANAHVFNYIFYETNKVSCLVKKHIDIYRENLRIEKRLVKFLFLVFIIQHLSHEKAFLEVFLSREDNILWKE